MAKKWAISDEPPLKVRLVQETERAEWGDVTDRPKRMRVIGRRIVKVLLVLWALSVGSWLQSCHHGVSADEPQDAIDGDTNPFDVM